MKSAGKTKSQVDKFRDAAREFETDDSDEAFEAAVRKIATAPKLSDEEIRELAKRQRDERRTKG